MQAILTFTIKSFTGSWSELDARIRTCNMVEVNWIKQKIQWLYTPYITHTQPKCIVSTNISPHNYSGASDLDYTPAFQGQPYIWNLMVMQSGLNLDFLIYVPDPGWHLRKIPHNLQQTNGHLLQISDFRKKWLKVPQPKQKKKKKKESKILVKNALRRCQSIHATDKRQNLYFRWDWYLIGHLTSYQGNHDIEN